MNEHQRYVAKCKLGIKAYQNIRAALQALKRLSESVDSDDHILLSSLFHLGIIRYGKPFTITKTESGSRIYPLKPLKKIQGFDTSTHKHLLEVRDTLVAHDDFDQIEPKLLVSGMTLTGSDLNIPMQVHLSNKCIGYPTDLESVTKMLNHVSCALEGVGQSLQEDIASFRQAAIDHPEQAREGETYSKYLGRHEIPVGGTQLAPPDTSEDPFLDPDEPDFSDVHNGFHYETIKLTQNFQGPETILLPDGRSIKITPPSKESP